MRRWLFLLFPANTVFSLNVAIYLSVVGKSHLTFVSSLIDLLIDKDHSVDLVLSRLNTGFDYKGVTKARNILTFQFNGTSPWMRTGHLADPFETSPVFDMPQFYKINTDLCRVGLEDGKVLSFLKNGNYDVMLVSQYEYCGLILAKAAGISSVIGYTSTNILPTQAIAGGMPNSPNWITSNLDSDKGSMTLLGRLTRLYRWVQFSSWRDGLIALQTDLAREFFGSNFPQVDELERNLDLQFVNSNEIIEIPRVLSPKMIYIGGVATSPPMKVTKEFDELLSSSKSGNILISFGTQIPSEIIPRRVKDAIISAAENFRDYNVFFKYDTQPSDGDLFKNYTNLHLKSWLPQKDLLFDGRISVFVSHMGLNSLLETSQAGVPLVSIPLFVDQGHNSRCAARLGTGVILEKTTFTGVELTEALGKILKTERYLIEFFGSLFSFKTNARSIAEMLKDRPNSAKERFIQWVEFAATHKNVHKVFNVPEAEASFFSYYCFDLVLFIGFLFFVGLFISFKLLSFFYKLSLSK